ncbi:MAG: hypothetical protein ORN57_02470 [Alphaproteobacteria bacterium]|nr:hypothetical protein [Alphaproteobacteria bacterium]
MGGSAVDDAGLVVAPQIGLEFNNGFFHVDLNARYMHAMKDVKYYGREGAVNSIDTNGDITYTSKSGPLSFFAGIGIGINF